MSAFTMNLGRKSKAPQTRVAAPLTDADVSWDEPAAATRQAAAPVNEADVSWDDAEKPKTSGGWATVRGALQGLTFGYSDEIAGAIDSAFGSETYEQARDRIRAKNAAHEEDHKVLYTGGKIAGGVVAGLAPGLNVAKGASVATMAGKAALQGGLQASGESNATTAEGVIGDTLKGAAIGGAVGGTLGAVGKAITGARAGATGASVAEEQASKMLTGEALDGARAVAKKQLLNAGSAGGREAKAQYLGQQIFEDPALRNAVPKGATALEKALEKRTSEIGAKLTKPWEEIDKVTGGLRVSDVVSAFEKRIGDLKGVVGSQTERDSLKEVLDDFVQVSAHKLKDAAVNEGAANPAALVVPTRALRELTTQQQKIASKTLGQLNTEVATPIRTKIAQDVKAILDEHLDEAAAQSPTVKSAVESIRETNQQLATYLGLKGAVSSRSVKELAGQKSFSETLRKSALSSEGGIGAGLSLATGSVAPIVGVIGVKLALPILESAGKYGVIQRALLAQAARTGESGASLLQKLIESGVPRGVATAAVSAATGTKDE